jgi:hypothetical protein
MVFDYYGPDINQSEIGDVCRTEPDPYGTFTPDMERAAHFSNLSTSVGSQLPENITGYTGRSLGYAAFTTNLDMDKLKTVLAEGYPIIMLWGWHYRVCVGYDSTYFFFQNSLMGELEKLTYQDFLSCWCSSGNYSLFISPWQIKVSAPRNVSPGNFTVTATITYPCPSPFPQSQYPSHNATATIILPESLNLAPTESAKKTIGTGDFVPMENATTITWNVQASSIGHYDIMVEAEGIIESFAPPIPSGYPAYNYTDRIGGEGEVIVAVTNALDSTPPTTSDDYDGLWHNQSVAINLSANDNNSGVMQTYYRINCGLTETINASGQPTIDTESVNNTLEYWSVDWAGNEEQHHILTGIKLDKTTPLVGIPSREPAGDVQPEQLVKVTVNVTDLISGVKNVTLYYSLDNGTTWEEHAQMIRNATTSLYEGIIPGQQQYTWVRYKIVAYDYAGNNATLAGAESYWVYEVMPEFLSSLILSLFMIATLPEVIVYGKKHLF